VTGLFVVSTSPAPLAGMAFPHGAVDWNELYGDGYRRVLRLHPGSYDPSPLRAHEVVLEDLFGGRVPSDPAAERERVLEAARLAAQWVAQREGVVVHCLGGTGRTGTVLACALRRLGFDADGAIRSVRSHRPGWPESDWQEELVREL
jgi:Protein-tyrosine phosphatase